MKAGAVEFLTKPFRERDLLYAIENALKQKAERSVSEGKRADAVVLEKSLFALHSAVDVEFFGRRCSRSSRDRSPSATWV